MKGKPRHRLTHPSMKTSKVGHSSNPTSTSLKSGSGSPAKKFMSGSKPKGPSKS